MKAGVIIIIIAIVLIAGWALIYQGTNGGQTFRPVPDVSVLDYSGNSVSLSNFYGKPLLINSWASWCPFCVRELPDFAQAQKEFGDKLLIIAINRKESKEIAQSYTDSLGVSQDLLYLLDPDDSFYRSIGGLAMPESIFVDTLGNIRIHKRGVMDINEIREKITELINKETL